MAISYMSSASVFRHLYSGMNQQTCTSSHMSYSASIVEQHKMKRLYLHYAKDSSRNVRMVLLADSLV